MKIGLGIGIPQMKKASGGASVTPGDIAGLQYWLDPANGVTKDGSNNVTAVADQSSNGLDLDGTGHTPLWVDAELNGNPILRFGGAAYLIDGSSAKSKYNFLHQQGTTFFAVVKLNQSNPGTRECLLDTSGLSTARGYNVSRDDLNLNESASVIIGNSSTFIVLDRSANTLLDETWSIWTIKTDLDNVTAAARCQHRINGADVTQANSSTGAISIGDCARSFAIGARSNGANDLANMDLAELFIYNSELDSADISSLESYLSAKFNITLA